MRTYEGGCHCGRIRFEVIAAKSLEVAECDCSICAMYAYLHLIVPRERFKLLCGADSMTTYTFNTGTALHKFCSVCGVKSFYIPRSHPDGISVNARCLDDVDVRSISIQPFNGRDWERGRAEYRDAPAEDGQA